MKTGEMIKTVTVLIVLAIIMSFCSEISVKAQNLNINKQERILKIKPLSTFKQNNPEALKIDIDIEKLRQIKREKKEAEERARQEEEERKKIEEANQIVFDGLTLNELSEKLNRSLHSTIAGKGEVFARYSKEYGIDPYLAVAIVMHETGCKWNCSQLLKKCNNVGGMKGSPGCGGGSYASFATLDDGINAFMNNLQKNYFSQGLNTPESMSSKYAASDTWAQQVRKYMNEIKAS